VVVKAFTHVDHDAAAAEGTTMDSERSAVAPLLGELVADIRAALGDDLMAIYLFGSYVAGDFEPGVSDLDLVAVSARQLHEIDLVRLGGTHQSFAGRHPEWGDRIEVVYIGVDALRSFRTSRGRLAVISPGEPFHLRDERPAEWIQNWYLVRETGVALFGPVATSLVPPVAWPEFVAALRRYAREIAARSLDDVIPGQLAYNVLTICRALRAVETDTVSSKRDAAAWVRERDPDRAGLIDAALRCRLSGGVIGFDDPESRSEAVAFIRQVADRTSGPSPG
jgi:predicted nucleotidyltransferase